MSAKKERYCTLRHARNKSTQAEILKNSPKHGYAQRFHAVFLMQRLPRSKKPIRLSE